MIKMRFFFLVCKSSVIFLLLSCAAINGLVEKGGNLIDGSMFAFKAESRWHHLGDEFFELSIGTERRHKSSEGQAPRQLLFSSPKLPYYKFYGSEPGPDGIFLITKMQYTGANYGGWNTYERQAVGRGRLQYFAEDMVSFTVLGVMEAGSIIEGGIRRHSERLSGERAALALQNRAERISFLTAWMHEISPKEKLNFKDQRAFERYWKPLLFPKNKRERNAAPAMPEQLLNLKTEGALEADWEEALSWIYTEYDWKKVTELFNNEFILTKLK